jgi:hypothetical protein
VNPAAQYADARRTALALLRAMKHGDTDQVDVITSGESASHLVHAAVVAAGFAAPFYSDSEIDRLVAGSIVDEASGVYGRMVDGLDERG